MSEIPDVIILIPPHYPFFHLVVLVGGPLDMQIAEWHSGIERLVMRDVAGWYELTRESGSFAEWKEGSDGGN